MFMSPLYIYKILRQQRDRSDIVSLIRFRGHLTWRDNASGGEHDQEEKTSVYGRVQGRRG